MVELDWLALTIPTSHGGLGMGFVELTVLLEELGRSVAPGPLLATVTQFAPAVREAGTAAQQERFLAAVAAGQLTGTLAVAEETADWDLEAVRSTARLDGQEWRLDGTKRFVLDGGSAQELAVAARVPGGGAGADEGIGVFVVPQSTVRVAPSGPPAGAVPLSGARWRRQRLRWPSRRSAPARPSSTLPSTTPR
jgi:alkylation response protein AidB-like acyl-CoA dehydrogenase